ncbi:MAG: D-alanyl-D-alanine carboxypeptidase [Raoultibacter sp.]
MPEQIKSRSRARIKAKHFFVRTLLLLLPTLLNIGRLLSPKIQNEIDYLSPGYTFALTVANTTLCCACQRTEGGSWKHIPSSRLAQQPITYTIEFRDPAYAFACFSGSLSLQGALAARLFTTRGPNDTGVALTYMFTTLLHAFFFWRSAYASSTRRSSHARL